MQRYLFLLISTLFIVFQHNAQVCMGDFVFDSQASLDDFTLNNPTCTTIDGSVGIELNSSITSLDNLLGIESITGELMINIQPGNVISDLSGLSNLQSVGDLYISEFDDAPFYISGLESLTSVNGTLEINCAHIPTLSPLDNLIQVHNIYLTAIPNGSAIMSWTDVFLSLTDLSGDLSIGHYGGQWTEFTGFEQLTHIGGSLALGYSDCVYIDEFSAFHNLQTIDGDLYSWESVFSSISGFENLISVDNIDVGFSCNCALPDFPLLSEASNVSLFVYCLKTPDFNSLVTTGELAIMGRADIVGFVSLQTVLGNFDAVAELEPILEMRCDQLEAIGGRFAFMNSHLTDLSFMSNLTSIGGGIDLAIHPNLSFCESQAICQRITANPELVFISANHANCDEEEDFLAFCEGNYATGWAFTDLNCNSQLDANEYTLSDYVVLDETNSPIGQILSNGQYMVPLELSSTSTFSFASTSGDLQINDITIATTDFPQVYDNNNFALCPLAEIHDVSIYHYSGIPPVPGFYRSYYVRVSNNWPQQEDDLIAVLDLSEFNFTEITEAPPGYSEANGVFSWVVSQLEFGEDQLFEIRIKLPVDLPVGSVIETTSGVTFSDSQISDNFPMNNGYNFEQAVVSSYDPNDIAVNTQALQYDELPSEGLTLDYHIRFQNTGNFPADFVRVTDFIEEDLDLGSIEILGASHTYQLSFNENREVEWLFENIQLPDSTTDLEGSQGYIHYRINTIPDVVMEDVIENTAAIYFDYNAPVITNTATTIFYECPEELVITTEGNYCEGESIAVLATYGWDDYSWTVNGIADGTGLGITLDNAVPGTYSVACEAQTTYCEAQQTYEILINPKPETPAITQTDNVLTASGNGVFIWWHNGTLLSETGNSLEITQSGNYSVVVADDGCQSETSSGDFTIIGVKERTVDVISIYPNPTSDIITVLIPENLSGSPIVILDAIGKQVMSIRQTTNGKVEVDCSNLPKGIYQMRVGNFKNTLVKQ